MNNYCISSGFPKLDKMLGGGFHNGEVILLASLPLNGKTTFAADCVKTNSGRKIAVFSLELGSDADKVFGSGQNIYIHNSFTASTADVGAICKMLEDEKGLELIVIDYLQLIFSAIKATDLDEELCYAMSEIKHIAIDLDIPILITSQLPRRSLYLKNLDLSILDGEDVFADTVLFLKRGEAQLSELTIEKNVHGETGALELIFENESFREV